MLSFKDYINEGLKTQEEEFIIDYINDVNDLHSLKFGKDSKKTPYLTASKDTSGYKVYSAYLIHSSEETKDFKKALKQSKSSQRKISPDMISAFIRRTAYYLYVKAIKDKNIDVIVTLRSSSNLSKDFAKEFANRIPNIIFLPDSLTKNPIEKVGISDRASESQKKELERIINNAKVSGKPIELKDIRPMVRQFLTGFVDYTGIYNKLKGKNILVVDDYLTTGSTLNKVFEVISNMQPLNMYGVTIFK